ncbi:protein-(glutamine-N5) methyltransferase, release factor-specific [Candidatus Falkowbacteria bacterium RIFOXYB2_FULL_38_15]|uniref:Release factor glutamine methyltransferase n=1 Tax=Candidatus Falkowbacteria bacterium RIFOXYA2_FULL_38_12 TaxID=1797993 RepID=A0A1F5S3D4_9BACT|nr:MAG: protein-(glutamine-N5) methyltransferase, release factor-specific [Candidatus Falkowbacteria bacterium RIFOXYA2_FULL_38_12]OGF32459.1 MAG: protein-(glutamine-N5) methyltransferase, release factor-specific [Candidatus Falkowbacteria bacterium RIFOXYB2_FULL_38_15]OGF42418.1 MAG: protein-(glutamine-N5) methyltransferase, release factor-specific [Candidatus Falkowbacteria bacterium RIFOXYD2_FULL_39_16]
MTIKQILINTKNISPLDAEILLSFVIKKSKEFLYTYPEHKLTIGQIKNFKNLVNRRTKDEPVAYLTNHKEFYGLNFYVNKNVLIPRPETETLVEEIIENNKNKKITIADIGTGSGCIAITLAKFLPKAKIHATDICKKALNVASKNAETHNVKINFIQGDLLEPLKNKKIDIVVANLPYGWKEWKNISSAETSGLNFEPQKALFTEENGLYLYRKLFEQIQLPVTLYLEFDPRQKKDLQKIIKKYLPKYKIKIKKDLAGRDRVLIASSK